MAKNRITELKQKDYTRKYEQMLQKQEEEREEVE
jgi:hypothetical protein